jgi:hypothetical protein
VTYPHEDALVIFAVLANHMVHRVLVDDDSYVNILSREVMSQTRIDPFRMTLVKTFLISFERSGVPP